jgi:hypothetical protein
MTPSLWTVPLQVIAVLENLGVRYHVGGSFASSIHGVPRQTRDLDLVAELMPGHVAAFAARLHTDFYLEEEAMRRAIERHSHFNLIHHATGFKVDLFVSGAGAFDCAEMERATPFLLGEDPPRSVLIKSAEDTLLRKLAWYRLGGEVSDRQWSDILGIVRVQAVLLDLPYLYTWAALLDVADLLDRALSPEREDSAS